MPTLQVINYNSSSSSRHDEKLMRCKKRGWHLQSECEEDSDTVATRQFNKLKSDLFKRSGFIPDAQNEIMNRNGSVCGLLRLPPEIRLRIYKLVLGGQRLWIGHHPAQTQYGTGWPSNHQMHRGGQFYHKTVNGSGRGIDLRLLRVCRQIFSETALLPYALNKFTFQGDDVRGAFERMTRPGKKLMQKKAIGEYEIMGWREFQSWMINEIK